MLRITTGDKPADVTIEQPANPAFPIIKRSIPANEVETVNLTMYGGYPGLQDEVENVLTSNNKSNKGIHITSTTHVTVYYEVYTRNNCDIFSLKGKNALGSKFYVPFQTIGKNGYSQAYSAIDIVATEDNTEIEITPSKDAYYNGGTATAGTPFTVTLDKGETFSLPPDMDGSFFGQLKEHRLSGTYIHVKDDKKIAVTKSDDSVQEDLSGISYGCKDLIGDQLVPLGILGKEYIAMRGRLDNPLETVYVIGTQDNTDLWFEDPTGAPDATVNTGETHKYEFDATSPDYLHIRASEKVIVLHVSGFGCEMGGAILPPTDKCTGSTQVGFTRSIEEPLGSTSGQFFLNIMVRDGAEDDFSTTVNGNPIPLVQASDFSSITGTSNWLGARLGPIDPADIPELSQTLISNSEDVFHLGVINGGETSGCRFGYFSDFNELKVNAYASGTGSEFIRTCSGESVQIYARGGTKYRWWPGDYLSDTTIQDPIADPPSTETFLVEVSGACNLKDTSSVTVERFPPIDAKFTIDRVKGCSPLNLEIHDQSTGIEEFLWDFDEHGISDQPNPPFEYDQHWVYGDTISSDTVFYRTIQNTSFDTSGVDSAQTYGILLIGKNTNDCTDTARANVTVYPEITADFTLDDLNDTVSCQPEMVDFQNQSVNEDSYLWEFGDDASNSDANPSHLFENISNSDTTYRTSLEVTSKYYCRDTAYMDFTIHSYLDAGFTVDTTAGCSPLPLSISHDSHGDVNTAFWSFDRTSGASFVDTTYDRSTAPDTVLRHTGSHRIDTVQIQLRVSNGNCYDTARRTVYVYPEVTADFMPPDTSSCNPMWIDEFHNNSRYTGLPGDTTALSYDWDFGDGGASNQFEPSHLFDNSNPSDTTYTVSLLVTSPHGCADSDTSIFTVSPYIKADFKVEETNGCSPFEVRFENTSEGGVDHVYWDFDEDDNTDSTITDTYFTRTFHNTGTVPDTVRLRQIVENEDDCQDTVYRNIIVYPHVRADYGPIDTIDCNPVEVSFRNHSEYVGTGDTTGLSYDWDFGDGSTSGLFEPNNTFVNSGDTAAVFPVSLRVSNPYGCADTLRGTVRARPFVEADFTISTGSGCSPLGVEVTNHSSGGDYEWFWDDSNMSSADTTGFPGSFTKTYTNTDGDIDTMQLTLVADNGHNCEDTLKRQIIVYPEVQARYDTDPAVALGCNPFEVTFDNQSVYTNTGDNTGLIYNWEFGDGLTSKDFEPTHTFVHAGDTTAHFATTLQAISPHNCRDTVVDTVDVHPYIDADFEVDQNKGCSPLDITITDNSSGGTTQYYWYWNHDASKNLADADSATESGSFTITYHNSTGANQVRNLTLIVTNGSCYDTLQREITVYSSIDAGFTQDRVGGCNPLDVQFDAQNDPGSTFSWEFGDGASSNQENPSHRFKNPSVSDTTFRVRYRATTPYGCTDTAMRNIHVHSNLRADFEIAEDEGCPPYNVTFDNTSVGNPSNTYQWSVDGTPVGSAPTDESDFNHTFTNSDPSLRHYEVELLAENAHGCSSVYRDTITVYHDVDADFTMDRVDGCSPLQVSFTDQASVPANTTYSWEFGDGATSSATDPVHTFNNYNRTDDTTFTIRQEVISPYNCRHDTSKQITVYHQPKARFDIDTTSSCPPLVTSMENLSRGHDSFEWRFGDGNTNSSDNVVTDYSYGGNNTNTVKNYNLELYVESSRGCADSTDLVLNVYPEVVADFAMDDPDDCHPHPVEFTDNSQNADDFLWDFDDGATTSQENPIHRFVNTSGSDTTYNVQLISSSAFQCRDTVRKSVEVFAQPRAHFTPNPQLQKWPENRVFINNASNQGPWDYNWKFGDGKKSGEKFPNYHDYNIWGKYTIHLRVESNTSYCLDTTSKKVQLLPPRTFANFSIDDADGCEPHTVNFSGAESPFVDQTNETYEYTWDFGDGSTGRGRYPTHVYDSAGTYYVSMEASGAGGTDIATDTVVVYKVPEIDFDVDPKLVMLPDQVMHCYNFTNHAENYKWNFGDGSTSEKKNPEHIYEEMGTYDIVLTASAEYNNHVCVDSLRKEELVNVEGKGYIEFPDAFTPSKSGPSEGYWDPEDTSNDIFHPVGEGVMEYKLEIFNKWGERLFISEDFRVGWDGYFEGELMPQDVYIYKAEGKFSNGTTFERMGNVTLLR